MPATHRVAGMAIVVQGNSGNTQNAQFVAAKAANWEVMAGPAVLFAIDTEQSFPQSEVWMYSQSVLSTQDSLLLCDSRLASSAV